MNLMQQIVSKVCRDARERGGIVPQVIQEELIGAGLSADLWPEVMIKARDTLSGAEGTGHLPALVSPATPRLEEARRDQVSDSLRKVIEAAKSTGWCERKQPVTAVAADGRSHILLCSFVSLTGIRLTSETNLLGQLLRIALPTGDGGASAWFSVRMVWCRAVSEQLFENGGAFLEDSSETAPSDQVLGLSA